MKKRTNKKKPALARSLIVALILALFLALGRAIAWLATSAYRGGRKNPLAATGCLLFVGAFSFIAFNALFFQTEKHHGPLFETREIPIKSNGDNHRTASNPGHVAQQGKPAIATPLPVPVTPPQGTAQNTAAFNLDTMTQDEIAALQTKLAGLKFYDGTIDGLKGPKTRAAIDAWKNGGAKATSQDDDIASLISSVPAADRSITTNAITNAQTETSATLSSRTADDGYKATMADILRVQAGLRAFGSTDVKITGEEDRETEKALRAFQKMFSLEETGKVNQAVLKKMQEIGLFG